MNLPCTSSPAPLLLKEKGMGVEVIKFKVSGQMKQKADLILTSAKVYCIDDKLSVAQAFAIKDGKFLARGTNEEILTAYQSDAVLNGNGKFIYPGFIDAHSHFRGYAIGLAEVDLRGCTSFDEVISRLEEFTKVIKAGWLVGRGWDQNLWQEKVFPGNTKLNTIFHDRPVVLIRVDGHVVLANTIALQKAGFDDKHSFKPLEVEIKNGQLTGILSETAADHMRDSIPDPPDKVLAQLLNKAQENCFAAGLTTVTDAGLDYKNINFLDSLQQNSELKIRLYAMLNPNAENVREFISKGPYKTDYLDVRSIKMYADGSLGSRTALLKKPYSDDPGKTGVRVTTPESLKKVCSIALRQGYQVNTHAIGDSGVKMVLQVYSSLLKGKNDRRWRIEHSQVVDPKDLNFYKQYSIIPSIQSTHATSDMRWAGDRLGNKRIRSAYAYKTLLQQNGWLPNGTDFPIEKIDPLLTFYAAVARKDLTGYPPDGFQTENALTREDALRSITIWAAKGCFEEKEKGSIEPGKYADFVILDQDIMTIPIDEVPKVKVLSTYLNGEKVFPE
ncbi:MAG: amidohydrolase family protein [Bacteroidetes bacterium]|nr:amidohydrolase family protein [Bacteroidota bacterium]